MILFPQWPTPREMAKLPWHARAQWGLLMILQFLGMLLGAACVLF